MTSREHDAVLDLALGALKESGAQGGEVFLEDHTVFSVSVADGRVEALEAQDVRGAGLRLFDSGRVAFTYTADLRPEGLAEAAAAARMLLKHSDPDDANRLPVAGEPAGPDPDIYDPTLARTDPHEKISVARRMEEAARATDPRVTRVRQSKYTDVSGRVEVANTGGLRRAFPFSRAYASIELTAEERGELQSGWHAEFAMRVSGLDPAHVGREAARRAAQKLGAKRTATRRANLVLDPIVAASLLEAIAPAFHADSVLKGKSLMASRVGRQVAGPRVTLVDDGRLPGGDHTAPCDAEGVSTRTTTLIESGVLRGYLHSTYTAARMGAAPTGNAARGSFKSPPRIGTSNLYLLPTGIPREVLMSEAGQDALYITEVMGLHTINPISGDFSVGASGAALRGGQPAEPVDRIAIAGNVLQLLSSIAAVATDLRMMPGGGAGSTTLLTGVAVSGT